MKTDSLQRHKWDPDGMVAAPDGRYVRYADVERFARELLVDIKLLRTQIEDLAKVINWRNV